MPDFSVSPPVYFALLSVLCLPAFLALAARVPALLGRNALQFLLAFCATVLGWGLALLAIRSPIGATDVTVALMILGCVSMFYLEVWALLSRGYTLGLLLTLYDAGKALDEKSLAAGYRGGDGTAWIMSHRLSGLEGAGLVSIRGERISLKPSGVTIAWAYKLLLSILGLRKTG